MTKQCVILKTANRWRQRRKAACGGCATQAQARRCGARACTECNVRVRRATDPRRAPSYYITQTSRNRAQPPDPANLDYTSLFHGQTASSTYKRWYLFPISLIDLSQTKPSLNCNDLMSAHFKA